VYVPVLAEDAVVTKVTLFEPPTTVIFHVPFKDAPPPAGMP
jgi:hypothetical protein